MSKKKKVIKEKITLYIVLFIIFLLLIGIMLPATFVIIDMFSS